jgi:hypothetical protein
MDTETRPPAHVVALLAALDSYANWLSGLSGASGSRAADPSAGQRALHEVLHIRRESFPLLTLDAAEILVVHTEIAALLYGRELRAIRGTAAWSSDELTKCAGLMQRQLAAIERLRRVVARPDFK